MAHKNLVDCPACGHLLAVEARACPHCGQPNDPEEAVARLRAQIDAASREANAARPRVTVLFGALIFVVGMSMFVCCRPPEEGAGRTLPAEAP